MSTGEMRSTEGIDVGYVAHLARLHLSAEETARFQGQLAVILQYIDELKAVDVAGIEPTAHAIPVENVFREDAVRPGLDHDAVMANAPSSAGGQFLVPKIIE